MLSFPGPENEFIVISWLICNYICGQAIREKLINLTAMPDIIVIVFDITRFTIKQIYATLTI